MALRIVIVLLMLCAADARACELLRQADSLYACRARGFDVERILADSALADSCIALYASAVEQCDCSLQATAYWKLLRAYFFRGYYATVDNDRKKELYGEAVEIGRQALDRYPESPEMHVWMATTWGLWAEAHGFISSATKGIAGKIRKHCERALKHDSTFADAGALRVLGGVHLKAPKIPLLLGWPSKKKAERYLNRALDIAPDNLFNKRCLAEILYERDKLDRACDVMASIVNTHGIVHGLVEDTQMKRRAKDILAEWQVERIERVERTDPTTAERDDLTSPPTSAPPPGSPGLPRAMRTR